MRVSEPVEASPLPPDDLLDWLEVELLFPVLDPPVLLLLLELALLFPVSPDRADEEDAERVLGRRFDPESDLLVDLEERWSDEPDELDRLDRRDELSDALLLERCGLRRRFGRDPSSDRRPPLPSDREARRPFDSDLRRYRDRSLEEPLLPLSLDEDDPRERFLRTLVIEKSRPGVCGVWKDFSGLSSCSSVVIR
jgi:hypothetical protein